MGQSGTGGDMKTMIAITTIGTVMGALMGSEIADNIIEEDNNYSQRIMNSAFEDDLRQVWRGQNQNILITPQEQVDVPICHQVNVVSLSFSLRKWERLKEVLELRVKTETRTEKMLGEEML